MYDSISGQNNSTYKLDLRIWLLNKSHIFSNKNPFIRENMAL